MMPGIDFDNLFPDAPPLDADGVARAGAPKPAEVPAADETDVVAALKTCYDPEIPVDIYELGLVYRCDVAADGNVEIDMTVTAPGCPVAGTLPGEVARKVAEVEGVGEVAVHLVWDPPWDQSRMSETARLELNMF